MDRHLKERMVGAVVVVAAVILISEILSGPRSTPQSPVTSGTTESRSATDEGAKLKTYTIDLSKPAPSAALPATAVPTPESKPPAPSATTKPTLTSDQVVVTAAPPAEDSTPDTAAPPPKPESSRPVTPSSPLTESPRAASPTAPGGWAVQVGSFGVRATSERIAADLKREGFSAFVVAFQSGNQTMYRVRVGPERNREAAEVLLRKLKLRHPTATLVAPT